MKAKLPFATFASALFIVLASFMPWAGSTEMPFEMMLRDDDSAQIIVTAWNSNMTAFGCIIPNWIVMAIAVLIAGFALLAALDLWSTAKRLNAWLCWYGTIHMLAFGYLVVGAQGRLGIGLVITLIAFIAMLLPHIATLISLRKSTPRPSESIWPSSSDSPRNDLF